MNFIMPPDIEKTLNKLHRYVAKSWLTVAEHARMEVPPSKEMLEWGALHDKLERLI